ncbi:hypothetical protein Air01nite_52580 [Asanoa iriomotensis]|uniref:Uncharacterized protein n=2 Tax=Asanoa iriomotensis TaxID=234613 RepID=A0ABQ4C8S7_9ACTN|nr:hypothetical protein Air01nite_52580 [Asanoa iriomotensis]
MTLMRVVRTVAGLVLLTIGLPVLLVGGSLWTLMQHRDAGGAFSGSLEPVSTPGQAIVVPDVDKLLREDAAFVRAGDTRMRLSAPGDTFFGLAPAAAVRDYLSGAAYTRVDAVTVARGDLPVRSTPIGGGTAAPGPAASGVTPGSQSFWIRQGSGAIEWTANEVDGRELSLVVMRVDAGAALTVDVRAAAEPGWLAPTSWSLLAAGVLLIAGGIAALAWRTRPRDVVFVVDPSQVPQVSQRLGGATVDGPAGPPPVWPALPATEVAEPVPVLPGEQSRGTDGTWPQWPSDTPQTRPATLADALAGAGLPATPPPGPAWPPAQPGPSSPARSPESGEPTPSTPSAWRRAEAARLAGLPAVTAVATQLSVEAVPTSGAPAGAATAIPASRANTDAAARTPAPRAEVDESDGRTPAQRSGAKHLRAVKSDESERPAKTTAAAKKRPVVFVDTAVEPTGESPDRPVVAARTRAKTAPQPRDADRQDAPTAEAEPTGETTVAETGPAEAKPAKARARRTTTKSAKAKPAPEPEPMLPMAGIEVIETAGSATDEPSATHSPAAVGTPVGTGAEVASTGDPGEAPVAGDPGEASVTGDPGEASVAGDPGEAPVTGDRPAPAKPKRTTRAKKATAAGPETEAAKPTRRRKTAEATEAAEAADKAPAEISTGTPFGGQATPPKRRRKTAAGLPAPENTEAGPAHNAVAALANKRPATTRRRAASPTNRATDQAS